MVEKGGNGGGNDGSGRTVALNPTRAGSTTGPLWLSTNKVTVPERVSGYVDRPELLDRIDPTRRRVTVLKAPGGFGKTVLLSECCRHLRQAGTVAAWLTLDAGDAAQTLDTYVAFAFEQAGMNILDTLDVSGIQPDRPGALAGRTRLLGMAVERQVAPCVLFLDELEQLDDGASVALVDGLVKWGPANLHIALACREIPASLDVASLVLAGRGELIVTDELRFSEADIARFLGPGTSQRRAASAVRESSGWPIALRLLRNEPLDETEKGADDGIDVAGNWVDSRLLRSLSEADRELLLDAGLFEWVDGGLLDEVLRSGGAQKRLEAVPALSGLFESVPGGTSNALRLHPLIREHCARRRLQETPGRYRELNRRLAQTLSRRGETIVAMRHAAKASDPPLLAEILENAGGVRLWLREGPERLQAADRLLPAELVERRPRLALVRCAAALTMGRLDEARRLYGELAARHPIDAANSGAEDADYRLDDVFLRGTLVLYGCEGIGSGHVEALIAEVEALATGDELDPMIRGVLEHSLSLAANLGAAFETALAHADRALRHAHASTSLWVYVHRLRGQVFMARGEVALARRCYAKAFEGVRNHYLSEPESAAISEILIAEINLERNRLAGIRIAAEGRTAWFESIATFTIHAAYAGVVLDLTLQRHGVDAALRVVERMLEDARAAGLPMLVRYLAAERVTVFVAGGRVEEAGRAWRLDGLPTAEAECLSLTDQSWREMEAVTCARLRLLTARGAFDAGRRFLHDLIDVASDRDLWRTRMRALALGVALERTAGRPAEAEGHLVAFLRLFAAADYARPLVRERTACLPALKAFLKNHPGAPEVAAARRLLVMLTESKWEARRGPTFSARELEVLQRIERFSDKDIAVELGLTPAGVRYHVGNIFGKLGVRDRRTAARRAQKIGLLS